MVRKHLYILIACGEETDEEELLIDLCIHLDTATSLPLLNDFDFDIFRGSDNEDQQRVWRL